MTTTPRLGSLFSGVGGLDLAIEHHYGAITAWHCQYEPPDPKTGRPDTHQYAARVLAQHWPDTPNLGDITAVDWDQVAAEQPVDILAGGFPCTDVSLAGARAGLNPGTRSGLWTHMARAIHALNPKIVVIENVRGLLSAPAHTDGDLEPCPWCMGDLDGEPVLRALGAVLGDLADLGFDAEWIGLPASDIGAPHQRFREFVLAWPAHAQGPRLEDRREGRPGRGGAASADTDQLRAHRPRPHRTGRDEPAHHRDVAADPARLGHRHTGSARLGRIPAAAVASRASAPTDASCDGRGEGRPEPARLGRRPHLALGGGPDWGPYEPAIRRWELVLDRPAPWPVDDRGRLSPDLTEWMMGYPAGWTVLNEPPAGMTASQIRNARLKACGNGVVPQQALAALELLHHAATNNTLATAA